MWLGIDYQPDDIFPRDLNHWFMDLELSGSTRCIENGNDRLNGWTALLVTLQLGNKDPAVYRRFEHILNPVPETETGGWIAPSTLVV